MATDTSKHDRDDAQLNAALNSWQIPPSSPLLATKISEQIIAAHIAARKAQNTRFAWSPMQLATATALAAVVGIMLGFAAPTSEAAAETTDTTDVIEMMW
jgi:hypothetical protein